MKKGVKRLIITLLIFLILAGAFVAYYLYTHRKLAGELVTDGLYLYKLDVGDKYHSTKIVNNNIYYWMELEDKYELYKMDIYTNKTELIKEFDNKDYYCYLYDEYIDCVNDYDNNKILYDYNLKELYNGEKATVIPYKEGLLKVDGDTVYYNDKEYKKLEKDLTEFNLYDQDIFANNAYLYFANFDDGCMLNVEDNKCEDYKYTSISKYKEGLYFLNENKIYVLNIETKEIKEYPNYTKDEYLTQSALDGNLLYYFSSDNLRIYNLGTDKVSLYDYRIKDFVNNLYLDKNLLYLVCDDKVYIIKLDEITTEEMTTKELEEKLEKRLTDRILNIKEKYNTEIKIRDDANLKLDFWKQSTTGEEIYDVINDSLDSVEDVFAVFGEDFFKEFIHDDYTGISVYMVSQFKSDYNWVGEAFRYYDKYTIIAQTYDFKRTLCHELMHTLEDGVKAKWNEIFADWDSYNPKDFKYTNDYNKWGDQYKYVSYSEDGDAYFVDGYSEVNGLEDRARIFENICMNTTDVIKDNPYILKKAEYLKEEVLKNYPMLKDSTIFDSLN